MLHYYACWPDDGAVELKSALKTLGDGIILFLRIRCKGMDRFMSRGVERLSWRRREPDDAMLFEPFFKLFGYRPDAISDLGCSQRGRFPGRFERIKGSDDRGNDAYGSPLRELLPEGAHPALKIHIVSFRSLPPRKIFISLLPCLIPFLPKFFQLVVWGSSIAFSVFGFEYNIIF